MKEVNEGDSSISASDNDILICSNDENWVLYEMYRAGNDPG